MESLEKKFKDSTIDLVDKYFPKGECNERGHAIVLYADILFKVRTLLEEEKTLYGEYSKGIIESKTRIQCADDIVKICEQYEYADGERAASCLVSDLNDIMYKWRSK